MNLGQREDEDTRLKLKKKVAESHERNEAAEEKKRKMKVLQNRTVSGEGELAIIALFLKRKK